MAQNKQLDFILENNNTGEKIYIKYSIWKSLSPSNIHEIIEDLYNLEQLLSKKDKLVIIVKSEPNDTLLNSKTNICTRRYIYYFVFIKRFNLIFEYTFVPNHTILNKNN